VEFESIFADYLILLSDLPEFSSKGLKVQDFFRAKTSRM